MTPDERQTVLDDEHLRLLALGYTVMGAIYAVFALIPLIYVAVGLFIALGVPDTVAQPGEPAPAFIGWILVLIGILATTVMGAIGALQLQAGRCLRRRRSKTLILVAAAVSCLMMPFGTVLGIFTFIVLGRPTVEAAFSTEARPGL